MRILTGIITVAALFASTVAGAKNYKAAEIYSAQSYRYGRFEMGIQSTAGSGLLSTFFLYQNNSEQSSTLWREIDIEIFGKDTNAFQTNIIVEKVEGKSLMTPAVHKSKRSLHASIHIYALEWTPDSISWFVDDSLVRTEKNYALLCNEPMSIRMNHWPVNNPSWVGAFDKTVLPTFQYVDYLSYSSYTKGKGDNGTDFTLQWKDEFNAIDGSRWLKADWTFRENYADFLPANVYTQDGKLVLKLYDATPVSVEANESSLSAFTAFPLPFNGTLKFSFPEGDAQTLCVYSANGQQLTGMIPVDSQVEESISSIISASFGNSFIIGRFCSGTLVDYVYVSK